MLPPNVQSLFLSSAKSFFAHHRPLKSGTTIQMFTTFGQSRHKLGLLPGFYHTGTGLLPGTNQTKLLMKTESLLCIAIPRVSVSFSLFKETGYPAQLSYTSLSANLPHIGHQNVMVMASLSVYSVSEPLGLTLGSQCTLETVIYFLMNFYLVQNSWNQGYKS